jgi:REP element-mobilizing transposase RayT
METAIPLVRSHSVSTLVVHVVWATAGRACVLTPEVDDVLGGWLMDKAQECGSRVLVAGNASDHVHLLVQHPPAMPVAELVRLLKGSSSHRAGVVYGHSSGVRWQAGYWAESVSPDQLPSLAGYVRRQREHHACSRAAEPWEAERPTR